MKRYVTVVCVLLAGCAFAVAQSAPQASKESVQKFFQSARVQQQIEQIQQAMRAQFPQMFLGIIEQDPKLTTEQKNTIKETLLPEMQKEMAEDVYPIPEMLNDIIPVVQRHFSDADITELVRFYESPIGQKLLNEMPPMSQEQMAVLMPKMQQRLQAKFAGMQQRIAATLKERMEKQTADPSNPKK